MGKDAFKAAGRPELMNRRQILDGCRSFCLDSASGAHTLKEDAGDIICDIMNHKVIGKTPNRQQLAKIKKDLEGRLAAAAGQRGKELKKIAERLGRKKKDRGGEPNWVREDCPELSPPLSIPQHSKELKKATAKSIIEQLLSDVDEWEIYFNEQDEIARHQAKGN